MKHNKETQGLGQAQKALISSRKSIFMQSILSLVTLKIEICQNNSQYQTLQYYMLKKYTFLFTQSKNRVVQAVRYIWAFYFFLL